eukprot:SAG22_NODE_452_length_10341_cov_12.146065_6_plen_169_part_00
MISALYTGVDPEEHGCESNFKSTLPRFGPGQGGYTVHSRTGIDPKPPSRVGPGTHIGLDGRHNKAAKPLMHADMATAPRTMVSKPLPEHLVDSHFSADDDDVNWVKGVRTRATAGECSPRAERGQVYSWDPRRRVGASPVRWPRAAGSTDCTEPRLHARLRPRPCGDP